MEINSFEVSKEECEASGILARFPVKINKQYALSAKASDAVVRDFNEAVLPENALNPRLTVNIPNYGLVSAVVCAIPGCLPDRMSIVTRVSNLLFLYDDTIDIVSQVELQSMIVSLRVLLEQQTSSRIAVSSFSMSKLEQLQAEMMREMIDIDQALALDFMLEWIKSLSSVSQNATEIRSLDEYISARTVNGGTYIYMELICFAIGAHLTKEEKEKLAPLIYPAMAALVIMNDHHSWPKEIQTHLDRSLLSAPYNAVAIIMSKERTEDGEYYTEKEAKKKVLDVYVELQESCLALVHQFENTEDVIFEDHQDYIKGAQYCSSGVDYWSAYSTRYPSKEELKQPEIEFVDGVFRFKKLRT